MTERRTPQEPIGLDAFLDAAKADAPAPSSSLMARIAEDGAALMPKPEPVPGFLGQLRAAVGGWPGLAGLATASAVGLWLGISPPDGLSAVWTTDAVSLDGIGLDPLTEFDLALMEG